MALRHDVQSGANSLKERLAIELQTDMRHGRVIYGGQVFNAKVSCNWHRKLINSG